MRKAPIGLRDLRRKLYVKAKAEPSWRFQRRGFGWKRWSRRWLYEALELFDDYKVKRYQPTSKAAPA